MIEDILQARLRDAGAFHIRVTAALTGEGPGRFALHRVEPGWIEVEPVADPGKRIWLRLGALLAIEIVD